MKKDKKTIILIIIAIILIAIDQGLKLLGNIIIYEEVNNEVGHNSIVSYVITNFIVLGIIIKFFINQKDRMGTNLVIIISFLLAGGISNLIDKIFRGKIVNYIKLFNLPAINLAYLFIIFGWIGLASIFAWNTYKEIKEKQNKQDVK